jgi:hypothetical protein
LCYSFDKNELGDFLGDFFTNSSGHPRACLPARLSSEIMLTLSTEATRSIFVNNPCLHFSKLTKLKIERSWFYKSRPCYISSLILRGLLPVKGIIDPAATRPFPIVANVDINSYIHWKTVSIFPPLECG